MVLLKQDKSLLSKSLPSEKGEKESTGTIWRDKKGLAKPLTTLFDLSIIAELGLNNCHFSTLCVLSINISWSFRLSKLVTSYSSVFAINIYALLNKWNKMGHGQCCYFGDEEKANWIEIAEWQIDLMSIAFVDMYMCFKNKSTSN